MLVRLNPISHYHETWRLFIRPFDMIIDLIVESEDGHTGQQSWSWLSLFGSHWTYPRLSEMMPKIHHLSVQVCVIVFVV